MGLRLPAGQVTVLLGPDVVRRRLMDMLDDDGDRAQRVGATGSDTVAARRERLRAASGAAIVLVDRLTDGLAAAARRSVLAEMGPLAAAGAAVLVDDADSVAALAVADAILRADPVRGLVVEPVTEPGAEGYLAS